MWLYCYASLVAILGTKYPHKIGIFTAYQKTTVQAHRRHVGDSWIIYDVCCWRQAAITKSVDWGQVEFNLYNETFIGRAKASTRCSQCMLEHASSEPCPFAEHKSASSIIPAKVGDNRRIPIYELYNHMSRDKCYFVPCKFTHKCAVCWGAHLHSRCPRDSHQDKRPKLYSRR